MNSADEYVVKFHVFDILCIAGSVCFNWEAAMNIHELPLCLFHALWVKLCVFHDCSQNSSGLELCFFSFGQRDLDATNKKDSLVKLDIICLS